VTKPRLAYLVNQYPKGSHTFIRREIAALEDLGIPVKRIAIRSAREELVDPADRAETKRTHVCLEQPALRVAGAAAWIGISRPCRFIRAVRVALGMYRKSERGLVRHLAYLVEAAYLAWFLHHYGIEHVHVHFGTNAAAVARLVQALGGPGYSMTVHGPGEFDAPIGLSLGAKIADARFVVAISHYCSAQLRRWARPEHWPKIAVVRCTVNESFLGARAPIDPDSQLFVNVGRLTPQKGQLLLLEAFEDVLRDHPRASLLLAGDGEMRPLIESAIACAALAGRVRLSGWLSEDGIRKAILASRVLVLPSFAEGLPVVLMEALALGRPVIATQVAGVPELIRPGESGWIVPAGDRDELAGAMKVALASPAWALEAMAASGARRVRARHRADREAATLAALFSPWICQLGGQGGL
jgi:colanic acid/amylovoran biosynthesis glycosyltransferase